MSGRSNLEELLAVLEEIRKDKYPHIPQDVIKEIVVAQFENQDKRLEARTKTNSIVMEYLASAVKAEEE